ncbi:unnamed protein product [Prunus armeniaca]|uniref:Uncharacterized protein n=1 Tax=Prunus armeniaca TaxID=36596 RepID=A0A6J5TME0_PRUAR|nr:unnamed protein product [Prunus armeniaca]
MRGARTLLSKKVDVYSLPELRFAVKINKTVGTAPPLKFRFKINRMGPSSEAGDIFIIHSHLARQMIRREVPIT